MLKWKINRTVDLSGDAPDVERLKALATLSTRIAHELRISVQENKNDADLSGFKVKLSVILPDKSSLMDAFDGAVHGCKVFMTLPDICYSQKGDVKGVLYLTDDDGGMLPIYAFVLRNFADLTDIFVDTANVVPSISELLSQMQTMNELTKETQTACDEAKAETARVASVREDAEQAVEDAQRAILATGNWGNVTVTVSMLLPNEQPVVTLEDTGTGKTMAFSIPRGLTGLTPNLRIGTVTTLSEGEKASATITGTAEAPVLNLWIPRGYTGSLDNMPFYTGLPSVLGEASPGTSDQVARGDHVHPLPTAEQVGARPNDWMPTAEEVGARPANWTPTAEEVGALPVGWMPSTYNGQKTKLQVLTGTLSFTSVANGTDASSSIVFDPPFADVPTVIAVTRHSSPTPKFTNAINATTAGCTIVARNETGAASPATINVNWIAIGPEIADDVEVEG